MKISEYTKNFIEGLVMFAICCAGFSLVGLLVYGLFSKMPIIAGLLLVLIAIWFAYEYANDWSSESDSDWSE